MTKQTGTAVLLEPDYGRTEALAVFADGPTVEDDVAAYRHHRAEEYLYHQYFSEIAVDQAGNRVRVACGDGGDACAEMEDALHSRYTKNRGVEIYSNARP